MNSAEIIPALSQIFSKYPEVRFESDGKSEMAILPSNADGFPITVVVTGVENEVYLGPVFHEHFESNDDQNEALCNYVLLASCGRIRMICYSKNGKEHKWTTEFEESSGVWKEGSTTGLISLSFWIKSRKKTLVNHLIPKKF